MVLRTHARQLITTCHPSSRGHPLFWPPWHLHTHMAYIHTATSIKTKSLLGTVMHGFNPSTWKRRQVGFCGFSLVSSRVFQKARQDNIVKPVF